MRRTLLLAAVVSCLCFVSCGRGLVGSPDITNAAVPGSGAGQSSSSAGSTSNSAPPSNPAPTPPAAPSQSTGLVLYVSSSINSFDSTGSMAAFRVDVETGALTQLAGSPFTVPSNITQLMPTPDGRFLFFTKYELDQGGPGSSLGSRSEGGLYRTEINPSGALMQAFTKLDNAEVALMHSSGRLLIFRQNETEIYSVDASSGDLKPVSSTGDLGLSSFNAIYMRQNDLWLQSNEGASQPSGEVFRRTMIDPANGKVTIDPNVIKIPAVSPYVDREVSAVPAPYGLFVITDFLSPTNPAETSMTFYKEQTNSFVAIQSCTEEAFAPCSGAPIVSTSPPAVVSPDGKFLFAFTGTFNHTSQIWTVPLDANTGLNIAAAHSINGDTSSYSNIILSNDGKWLYLLGAGPVGPQGASTLISGFRVNSDGALTATPGSPYIFKFAPRIWFACVLASIQK